ncbi:anhydro-N-acetylmuramic acid kinase [Streptomyces sp. WMMC500]|uniref:anhydro-N-acetylmuramic acid kinase n=1 Tax=Streptomyces sp. WMMC500 TaxID=3015154 RepID=UPI00248BD7A1|nr:anhydro-N-acetylmuramic acid kinase [Streptomyces sp. WMMC500]WBB60594.1 anhydro-N-acetylmuramic acid kinase [Streptomyces sp. WMMC500]
MTDPHPAPALTVLGLLSGTSYDAVDAAVCDLRLAGDELHLHPRGLHSVPFPDELRRGVAACLPPARTTVAEVCRLDTELGRFFGRVAAEAVETAAGGHADLVVSHGQTVYHWVEGRQARGTLQLGNAAWIAEATGLPVVSDVRVRDIARGGQGAPLASTLDALLLLGDGPGPRRGALNLGGIANVTVRGGSGEVVAYDLGPANALIDAAVTDGTDGAETMDTDGARARRGTVDRELLRRLLAEPYYALAAPKSTGKELFHGAYLREQVAAHAASTGGGAAGRPALDDLVATVTELTAELVAAACREYGLEELVVSGGGVRNPALMARLAELCAPARVSLIEDHGLSSQGKEGYLFALLGFLTVCGLPASVPSATGAREAAPLGSITPGARPLRLPEPAAKAPVRLRVV